MNEEWVLPMQMVAALNSLGELTVPNELSAATKGLWCHAIFRFHQANAWKSARP